MDSASDDSRGSAASRPVSLRNIHANHVGGDSEAQMAESREISTKL